MQVEQWMKDRAMNDMGSKKLAMYYTKQELKRLRRLKDVKSTLKANQSNIHSCAAACDVKLREHFKLNSFNMDLEFVDSEKSSGNRINGESTAKDVSSLIKLRHLIKLRTTNESASNNVAKFRAPLNDSSQSLLTNESRILSCQAQIQSDASFQTSRSDTTPLSLNMNSSTRVRKIFPSINKEMSKIKILSRQSKSSGAYPDNQSTISMLKPIKKAVNTPEAIVRAPFSGTITLEREYGEPKIIIDYRHLSQNPKTEAAIKQLHLRVQNNCTKVMSISALTSEHKNALKMLRDMYECPLLSSTVPKSSPENPSNLVDLTNLQNDSPFLPKNSLEEKDLQNDSPFLPKNSLEEKDLQENFLCSKYYSIDSSRALYEEWCSACLAGNGTSWFLSKKVATNSPISDQMSSIPSDERPGVRESYKKEIQDLSTNLLQSLEIEGNKTASSLEKSSKLENWGSVSAYECNVSSQYRMKSKRVEKTAVESSTEVKELTTKTAVQSSNCLQNTPTAPTDLTNEKNDSAESDNSFNKPNNHDNDAEEMVYDGSQYEGSDFESDDEEN